MSVPAEIFPLLWSPDVAKIADWAIAALDLTESWRAANDDGTIEHAELLWLGGESGGVPGGRISINIKGELYAGMGPSGISLRFDDREFLT